MGTNPYKVVIYHDNDSSLNRDHTVGLGFDSHAWVGIISPTNVNITLEEYNQLCLIYDVNNVGMEEKFINTIIFCDHGSKDLVLGVDTPIFRKWQQKVDFQFGFVPLGGQLMPDNTSMCHSHVFPH